MCDARNSSTATLTEKLATFLRARPGEWIDGRRLAEIAGSYAWRTRVSDLRRGPYFMAIVNRQRRVRSDGAEITISEYMFVGVPASLSLPLESHP